jgi:hypothetical protein
MSKAKENIMAAASKKRGSSRPDEPPVIEEQDRSAHFSSDWTLVIDGIPVAAADEDGIGHWLPEPATPKRRKRPRPSRPR